MTHIGSSGTDAEFNKLLSDLDLDSNLFTGVGHDDVQVPQVRNLTIDDFENGTLDSAYDSTAGTVQVQSSTVYEGTYALEVAGDTGAAESNGGLKAYPQPGDTIDFAVYLTDTDQVCDFRLGQDAYVRLDAYGDNIEIFEKPGNKLSLANANISGNLNEWIVGTVEFGTDLSVSFTATETGGGTDLATVTATLSDHIAGGVQYSTYQRGTSGAVTSYWDSATITRREPKAAGQTSAGTTEAGNELLPSGGAHVLPLEAPADHPNFPLVNEPVTDGLAAGDPVGYSLDLDETPVVDIGGEADGSGGTQNETVDISTGGTTALSIDSNQLVEVTSGDLRLATGQAIEDGGGTSRIQLDSDRTEIRDEDGDNVIQILGGSNTYINARSDAPVNIFDSQASSSAITYSTSSTLPGTLTLNADTFVKDGAGLVVGNTSKISSFGTAELQIVGTASGDSSFKASRFSNNDGPTIFKGLKSRAGSIGGNSAVQNGDVVLRLQAEADDGGAYDNIVAQIEAVVDGAVSTDDTPGRWVFKTTKDGARTATEALRIDSNQLVEVRNGDLRIPTGGKIEDGSGQHRIELNSNQTLIRDEVGNQFIRALSGSHELAGQSGVPVKIVDQEGGFTALDYTTAASAPGTLTLDADTYVKDGAGLVVGDTGRVTVGTFTPLNQKVGDDNVDSAINLQTRFDDREGTHALGYLKSRATTPGNNTQVNDGDNVALIWGRADDGSDYDNVVGDLVLQIDGTPGTDDTPGRWVFRTTPDGSNTPTEALRIDSAQDTVMPNGSLGVGVPTGTSPARDLEIQSASSPSLGFEEEGLVGGFFTVRIGDGSSAQDGNLAIIPSQGTNSGRGALEVENDGGGSGTYGNLYLRKAGDVELLNGDLLIQDGSASDPALAFDSDGDTGVYRNAGGDIRVSTNGSDNLVIAGGNTSLVGGELQEVGGTTDASSGAIRMANANSIFARDSGNGYDFGFTFTSSDTIRVDSADVDAKDSAHQTGNQLNYNDLRK